MPGEESEDSDDWEHDLDDIDGSQDPFEEGKWLYECESDSSEVKLGKRTRRVDDASHPFSKSA